jgi:hypothetical protein
VRLSNAFREWRQLRARVRDEYGFHIDRAAADFQALGLSRREARRLARARFGGGRHLRIARREIGGDLTALADLLRAHGVHAQAWLQPAILAAATLLILLLSPAPRVIVESVIGLPLPSAVQTVFLSAPAPWPLFTGITAPEFETLRSIPALTEVARYREIYVRAVIRKGVRLDAVESEVRQRTGNPGLRLASQFEQTRIGMGPAFTAWMLIGWSALLFLRSRGVGRSLLYAIFGGCLHMLASLSAWALAIQLWNGVPWPNSLTSGGSYCLLLTTYLLATALQYRCWMRDLDQRCPICLGRLVLAVTHGDASSLLLSAAVTESVCARGHGVLMESRWVRRFRPEESPLDALIRV